MDLPWPKYFLLSAVLAMIILSQFWRSRHRLVPYPPGPPGLPILGNFLDIPRTAPWIQFAKWRKKYGMWRSSSSETYLQISYSLPNARTHILTILWLRFISGPVIYLNLLGRPLVVLNTAKATIDLLERRGGKYANRPGLTMVGEMYVSSTIYYLHSTPETLFLSQFRPVSAIRVWWSCLSMIMPTANSENWFLGPSGGTRLSTSMRVWKNSHRSWHALYALTQEMW